MEIVPQNYPTNMTSSNSKSTGQPLFLVDHDWLRQDSKSRKSWTGNVRNRSLYGLAIQVSEHGPSTRQDQGVKKSTKKRRAKSSNGNDSDSTMDPELLSRQNSTASLRSTSVSTLSGSWTMARDTDNSSTHQEVISDSESANLLRDYQSPLGATTSSLVYDQSSPLQADMDKCEPFPQSAAYSDSSRYRPSHLVAMSDR